jgi:DeoR/GlpR family transcriptional regulator of sugar metabolism
MERNIEGHEKRTKRHTTDPRDKFKRTWVNRAGKKAERWKTGLVKHVVTHDFINYGDSLALGSGTTPMYLVKALVEAQIAKDEAFDLAIVTSNLQVLYEFRDAQLKYADVLGNTQVIVTGGRLNNSLDSMIGDYAALSIRSELFNPRVVFVGAAGLTFRGGLNISYQFEEEISTQKAFATRSTTSRVLLCDHEKLGKPSFYNLKLTIEELMKDAHNCYVITTYDPDNPTVMAILEQEEKALTELLQPLVGKREFDGKDFVFRMVREDGSVERELRLGDIRKAATPVLTEAVTLQARAVS